MGMHELAIAGLVGSGMGAVLGAPLVWPRSHRPELTAFGAATVLMAGIAGLISARLVGLVPSSLLVSHAINVVGLAAFVSALRYVRVSTGRTRTSAAALATPLAAYGVLGAVSAWRGMGTLVPFAWLVPIVVTFTGAGAWALWRPVAPLARPFVPPAWVVGFMGLVNVAQLVRMDFGHVPVIRAVVPAVVVLGFAGTVAMISFRVAGARASAPAPVTLEPPLSLVEPAPSEPAPSEPAAPADVAGYVRSGLDDTMARTLLARIAEALDRDRLFARSDLSLAVLAHAVDSTPHLVSEALNRVGGTSFRDVVTRRRVEDVKAQLDDPANDRFTIEGLGTSAGFRSRSAMYEAFKRHEGTTPTAYRDGRRRGLS